MLAAREQGYQVVPIPGASAVISALSVAGLPTDKFRFMGFLPAKRSQRKKALGELSSVTETMVFYEAPHRILDCLADAREVFGGEHPGLLPGRSARPSRPIFTAVSISC